MSAGAHAVGPDDATPVVALVASAGGVDALSRVLEPLPEDLPAAIIAQLHIDPASKSFLTAILSRHCALPVVTTEDGMELLPSRVHVTPPGSHLLVTADARAALIECGAFPPSRPSADLLLTTMAMAAGPRAIAVVLTGHGHDGATGATAIHRFGGTVLASDKTSSEVFSMPSATIARDHAVDHVVALDDIPELLVALVSIPTLTGDAPSGVPG